MPNHDYKIAAIIPIYNPPDTFEEILEALINQSYSIHKIQIIDSSPLGTQDKLIRFIARFDKIYYKHINSYEFDHGGTRNLGIEEIGDADFVLLLTQDALLKLNCVKTLIEYVISNKLKAAFARQIPRRQASSLEIFERNYNYPEMNKISHGLSNTIESIFFSDVCSLIEVDTFYSVGKYPNRIITAEDMVFAYKLLKEGFSLGYCAEAQVIHSHQIKFMTTFKRYFDTGVMHSQWAKELPLQSLSSRGTNYVRLSFNFIITNCPWELRLWIMSIAAKAMGYFIGRRYKYIPQKLRLTLSNNKVFWTQHDAMKDFNEVRRHEK